MKITFKRGPNLDVILAHVPEIGLHMALDREKARKFVRGSGIRLPRYKSDRIVEAEIVIRKPE